MLFPECMEIRIITVSVQCAHTHPPYAAAHASSGTNSHHFAPPRHIDRPSLLILQAIRTRSYTSPASVHSILLDTAAQPRPSFRSPSISMNAVLARIRDTLNNAICREVRIRNACA